MTKNFVTDVAVSFEYFLPRNNCLYCR